MSASFSNKAFMQLSSSFKKAMSRFTPLCSQLNSLPSSMVSLSSREFMTPVATLTMAPFIS
uniref:Uncharacterized protein n=1 Tax=Arundo donax TaxID=35708 RepID=A0A0A9F8U6_ARUDO